MCLEITYLAIPKYPEFFLDALKTDQNEKYYIFQEIGIPEIHVWLSENFQKLEYLKIDVLPSHKTLSGWQMKLSLVKKSQIALWVKYARTCKANHKSYLKNNILIYFIMPSLSHISMVSTCFLMLVTPYMCNILYLV